MPNSASVRVVSVAATQPNAWGPTTMPTSRKARISGSRRRRRPTTTTSVAESSSRTSSSTLFSRRASRRPCCRRRRRDANSIRGREVTLQLETQDQGGQRRLRLSGRWTVEESAALEPRLLDVAHKTGSDVVFDTAGIEAMDLTGAWLLRSFERRLQDAGRHVEWAGGRPEQLEFIDRTEADHDNRSPAAPDARNGALRALYGLGLRAVIAKEAALDFLGFIGVVTASLGRIFGSLRRLRLAVHRAARLRNRPDRRADRRADRFPDQRDRRLHRRPAAAEIRRRDFRRRSRDGRRTARAGCAPDRDHRCGPIGQRIRRRDRRDEAE